MVIENLGFIYLYGFHMLLPLSQLIETRSFIRTNRRDLLCLKPCSDRLVIVAKRFFYLQNLLMIIKQDILLLSRNLVYLVFVTSGQLQILLPTDFTSVPPLFNVSEVLSFISDKSILCAEIYYLNSNLDDFGSSLPSFTSRTKLKLYSLQHVRQYSSCIN